MTTQYQLAQKEVENGMLKVSKQGYLELFCYTRDCFYGADTWNETTLTHRGALYYKGVPVNKPFKKIFNLDEQPETGLGVVLDRMDKEPFNIYDKANGHLFIMSAFVDDEDEQQIVFHTKGNLDVDHELLAEDIKLFLAKSRNITGLLEGYPVITLMFEALVEHDKHTMYSQQVAEYGDGNTFILLGGNIFDIDSGEWIELQYENLEVISQIINMPVVKRYESVEGTPNQWLDHTDREGYVIHFWNGDRVKIKTKEYWALRFKKDLHADRIIQMFRQAGFERINRKLPEEVSGQIVDVLIEHFNVWYADEFIGDIDDEILERYAGHMDRALRKELFTREDLTEHQKLFLVDRSEGTERDLFKSRMAREEYVKFYHANDEAKKSLQESLEAIINTI